MKLQADYPVSLLCDLLALPRSSWYYKPAGRDEADLQRAVEQVIGQFPTYGSRRVTHQLRRGQPEFKTIGRKRVRRVLARDLEGQALKASPVAPRQQDGPGVRSASLCDCRVFHFNYPLEHIVDATSVAAVEIRLRAL